MRACEGQKCADNSPQECQHDQARPLLEPHVFTQPQSYKFLLTYLLEFPLGEFHKSYAFLLPRRRSQRFLKGAGGVTLVHSPSFGTQS
jgi:hypothetical protein